MGLIGTFAQGCYCFAVSAINLHEPAQRQKCKSTICEVFQCSETCWVGSVVTIYLSLSPLNNQWDKRHVTVKRMAQNQFSCTVCKYNGVSNVNILELPFSVTAQNIAMQEGIIEMGTGAGDGK